MTTLSNKAYEQIKERIIDLDPGSFLSVRKCASELNLSYTPTREALLRLNKEGMLDLIPNVGFFVQRVDMQMIHNIYQCRECVEQYALPIAVRKLNQEDIIYLKECIKDQKIAVENSDFKKFTEVDELLHCCLIDKLNNKPLTEFYQSIRGQYRIGSKNMVESYSKKPIEEHEEFMELIENEKYDEAVTSLLEHSRQAMDRMREGYVTIG